MRQQHRLLAPVHCSYVNYFSSRSFVKTHHMKQYYFLVGLFVADPLLNTISLDSMEYEGDILDIANCNIDKNFYCFQCSKGYKNKRHLRYHVNFECGKLPKYQCLYCNRRAHRKSNVNYHIKHKHPGLNLLP